MATPRIKVTGLTELILALEKIGGNPRQVMQRNDAEVISAVQTAEVAKAANNRQRRKTVGSNQHRSTAKGVEVQVGANGASNKDVLSWAVAAQFGSTYGHGFRRPRVNGYVTVPALRANSEIVGPWADAIADVLRRDVFQS